MVVDDGIDTGPRLKLYSRPADVEYWTERWTDASGVSYERERRGHLPHQLRSTWKRWVEPGSSVLEAGCGLGHFTVAAHALGYRAEGVDWSEPTIARLRTQFPSIAWQACDVRRLPFADRTFDSGIRQRYEHLKTRPGCTRNARVLQVGGIASVSSLFQRLAAAAHQAGHR
jgi:ubiquinone/menaquinone biosynthesis C-methylase UbiE